MFLSINQDSDVIIQLWSFGLGIAEATVSVTNTYEKYILPLTDFDIDQYFDITLVHYIAFKKSGNHGESFILDIDDIMVTY